MSLAARHLGFCALAKCKDRLGMVLIASRGTRARSSGRTRRCLGEAPRPCRQAASAAESALRRSAATGVHRPARVLMNGGCIILADEPTGALNSQRDAEVMALLHKLADTGHTIILITHDREVAAQARRVIEIRDGLDCHVHQQPHAAAGRTGRCDHSGRPGRSREACGSGALTLPLFRVVINPRFTRPFCAVPRTSIVRTASG